MSHILYRGFFWTNGLPICYHAVMTVEEARQYELFSGDLVDTRSAKQKRRDNRMVRPQQSEMFSQRELAQFGVKANPTMPLSSKTRLELAVEDPRSQQEKDQAVQAAAEKQTYPMFNVSAEKVTPLYSQYSEIKKQFPDAVVLFRLGDFYEAFSQDAETLARELDVVLTSRMIGKDRRIPMAGVPYHVAENYINRLIAKGHHVAVCEQIGDQPINGLIPREVMKIISPTILNEPPRLEIETPPAPVQRPSWEQLRQQAHMDVLDMPHEGEFGVHEI